MHTQYCTQNYFTDFVGFKKQIFLWGRWRWIPVNVKFFNGKFDFSFIEFCILLILTCKKKWAKPFEVKVKFQHSSHFEKLEKSLDVLILS